MAFATSDDIAARWRPLNSAEQEKAEVLLEDAATYLSAYVVVDEDDEQQASILKMVSCSMVIRAMIASENNVFGVTEQSISADIYSQTMRYQNPSGDLYLTSAEKRLLGITSSYLTSIRPVINPGVHHAHLW